MKTKIKQYGTIALFVAFSFIATVAFANNGNGDSPSVELKYLGNVNSQPVFQLNLNVNQEQNFTISIKDQFGEVLYLEKVKAKTFTRNFRLNTESLDDAAIKVEVVDGNKKAEVFTINRSTRFVEETSISKL